MSAKEVLEHGFYITIGLLTFQALGEMKITSEFLKLERATHHYNMSAFRELLIRMFGALSQIVDFEIPDDQTGGLDIIYMIVCPWLAVAQKMGVKLSEFPILGNALGIFTAPAMFIHNAISLQKRLLVVKPDESYTITVWTRVPLMWRSLFAVMIPSLLYLTKQFVEKTVEMSGLV